MSQTIFSEFRFFGGLQLSAWAARPAAILRDELDASGFQGGAHLIDAAYPRVLPCFKPIDGIHANASGGGGLQRCPI
jgi:hypothetical protein